MPFSHHSHSGQFCHHASNTLEEMVQAAIAQKMSTYCLTEHMPREAQDLYPEEIEHGRAKLGHSTELETSQYLFQLFDAYYNEARRLQKAYADQITLLVGMEIDWIRPSSGIFIASLQHKYDFELIVGSVHHVHGIPIDFSKELLTKAQDTSGSETRLFEDYFDLQWHMLQALRPPIVGHFDLIRLFSNQAVAILRDHPPIWSRIIRNVDFIVQYGGIVEINSAGLRKGLAEPYPTAEICRETIARGGLLTLSDDAHSVEQIGNNYARALAFARGVGLKSVAYLSPKSQARAKSEGEMTAPSSDILSSTATKVKVESISLDAVSQHAYITASGSD